MIAMRNPSAATWIPEECRPRLEHFAALVGRWNPKVNLVSRSSVPDLWHRHIVDSAQLVDFAPAGVRRWVDLGSGAGFPGLVVAIIGRHTHPEMSMTLVESDRRKAAFLTEAARVTDTKVDIIPARAEHVEPLRADVVSARALAPLAELLPLVERHLVPTGVALLLKGSGHQKEVDDAKRAGWRFAVTATPSVTDPAAVVLELREFRRV